MQRDLASIYGPEASRPYQDRIVNLSSVSGFLLIETAFILVHYAIVSPLIAAVYARES
jgi:hypothetical protein